MFYSREELFTVARNYVSAKGAKIVRELGHGTQGVVFETSALTAVKVYKNPLIYERERNVYLRLERLRVSQLHGFNVPSLSSFDDEQRLIEISIVTPPYILDFGGAYLDQPPEHFSRNEEWETSMRDAFGGTEWAKVSVALNTLEIMKIFVVDINTSNIVWIT